MSEQEEDRSRVTRKPRRARSETNVAASMAKTTRGSQRSVGKQEEVEAKVDKEEEKAEARTNKVKAKKEE